MAPAVSLPTQMSIVRRKDLDYYMTSEFVVFLVEDVLFRIPTYVLVSESDVFSTMFPLPQGNKPNAEGTSAENPIKLPEKSDDFKGLLKILYPLKPCSNPTNPLSTRDEWISILKLATKWHFWNARKIALQALQSTKGPSTERVTLGRALKISKWVLDGYQELSNIDETPSITNETAATIGWEATVKLQQIREDKLRNRNSIINTFNTTAPITNLKFPLTANGSTPPTFSFAPSRIERSVEEVFKEELSQIRLAESQYSKSFESVKGSGSSTT